MTYQKHTTHTDALDTLGSIIGPDEKRDAIHLAVFPAIAGHRLRPGNHVALAPDGLARVTPVGEGVGIVDPFLGGNVEPGQRFWLVVYPRQISSLRHVWEHDAFPPSGETPEGRAVEPDQAALDRSEASRQWLVEYIDRLGVYLYEDEYPNQTAFDVITQRALEDPAHMRFGFDIYGEIPAEFWLHLALWSGQTIGPERSDYFSCAC